jgi:hypothetical protein
MNLFYRAACGFNLQERVCNVYMRDRRRKWISAATDIWCKCKVYARRVLVQLQSWGRFFCREPAKLRSRQWWTLTLMSTTGHGSKHGSGSGTAQDELWLELIGTKRKYEWCRGRARPDIYSACVWLAAWLGESDILGRCFCLLRNLHTRIWMRDGIEAILSRGRG